MVGWVGWTGGWGALDEPATVTIGDASEAPVVVTPAIHNQNHSQEVPALTADQAAYPAKPAFPLAPTNGDGQELKRGEKFTVRFIKTGNIGVSVKKSRFEISTVKNDGCVDLYNRTAPKHLQIRPKDQVVEVNGNRDLKGSDMVKLATSSADGVELVPSRGCISATIDLSWEPMSVSLPK